MAVPLPKFTWKSTHFSYVFAVILGRGKQGINGWMYYTNDPYLSTPFPSSPLFMDCSIQLCSWYRRRRLTPLSLNRKKRSSPLRRLKPCESNANHISHISPSAAAAPSTSFSPFFVLSRRAEESGVNRVVLMFPLHQVLLSSFTWRYRSN